MFWIFSLLAFILAAAGYRSAARTGLSAYTSSFTSGLVAGLGLLVALPEAVSAYGMTWALAGAAAGIAALALFDHWVHPLCENCAQSGVLLAMLSHAMCDGAIAGAGTSGRIYKIVYGTPRNPGPLNLAALDDAQLVQMQLHPNDWQVRHARRLLQERAAAGRLNMYCTWTHGGIRRLRIKRLIERIG